MLDESKAFVESEKKGFDLSMPAKRPTPPSPIDMQKHHKMLAKQVGDLRDEENGLDAKTDAEFAALSKQIDDPGTSDADRLAARERREMLEALEDRRRESCRSSRPTCRRTSRGPTILRRAVRGAEELRGDRRRQPVERLRQTRDPGRAAARVAARGASPPTGGLKSSMGAEHQRLSGRLPPTSPASFPRLGYTGDQKRWLEQRIAYLEKRVGELPNKPADRPARRRG
jgi:hypothetical protein